MVCAAHAPVSVCSLILTALTGVYRMLADVYPSASPDALRWRHQLETLSTSEFEEQQREELGERCPGRFFDQMKGYHSNPHFFDYETYRRIPAPKRRPWMLRLFLYCELGLNENFHGEGRTRHPSSGSLAQKEFLTRNFTFPRDGGHPLNRNIRIMPVSNIKLPQLVCQRCGGSDTRH